MSRLTPDAISTSRESAMVLWENRQSALVLQTLQLVVNQASKQSEFALLQESLFHGLPEDLLQAEGIAELYGFVLCRARKQQVFLDFFAGLPAARLTPELQVLKGWAMLSNPDDQAARTALDLLQAQGEKMSGWFEGLRLRTVGDCMAQLGLPDWEVPFQQARGHLHGIPLGLCIMQEGTAHYTVGKAEQARTLWATALPLLKEDPHYHAWLRYNLGITSLGPNPIEAERHFLELEQLRNRHEAKDFQASALRGLAAARRALGELDRAMSCLQEGFKRHPDVHDREQLLWGMGYTLLQAGHWVDGLAHLQQAFDIQQSNWIRAYMALAQVGMGDLQGTLKTLQGFDTLNGKRSGQVALLCLAEVARQTGQIEEACKHLQNIDFKQPHLKEERRCLELLFRFAEQQGFPEVQVLPLKGTHTIEVQAEGVLRVKVNGRHIPIKPTSKGAELLVRLLEKGGQDTLESLLDTLFRDTEGNRRKAGQALWNHVKKLRSLLGWEESILAPGGAFLLDPGAHWVYDIALAREQGRPVRGFLEGVYSEWVLETQQELRD